MPVVLNIQSSPNIAGSTSRQVSQAIVDRYQAQYPDLTVTNVDLVLNPPSHLGTDHLGAFFAPPETHSPAFAGALAASERYLSQLFAADVVILGTPMHNFGITSVLKSWIDNIVRVGRTFKYGETGNIISLLDQKKIIIVVSNGGKYGEGPMTAFEHAGKHLESVFQFFGMQDIVIVRVEAQNMGPDFAASGLADALAKVQSLSI